MAATVCESLDALLESTKEYDSDDEELPLQNHQARLCENLIHCLNTLHCEQEKAAKTRKPLSENGTTKLEPANNFIHTSIDYNNKRNEKPTIRAGKGFVKFQDTTIREVFADSNKGLCDVPTLLASLMMTRVETEKLLPPTQDAEANEEAMTNASAIMLTRPALVAAQLYSMLLSIPGATGSRLIVMEAVSSLSALFRRWRVECVTAVDLLVTEKKTNKNQKKTTKRRTRKRKSSKRTTTNPIKQRGRGRNRTVVFPDDISTDDDEEDESSSSSDDESNDELQSTKGILRLSRHEDDNDIISPLDVLILGLKAALALSEVLMQKEFMSWSSEAREALIDAVTSSYGTVCALVTPSARPKLGDRVLKLQEEVLKAATTCLLGCIFTSTISADEDDAYSEGTTSVSTKRHETSVFLFRGLYPILTLKESLPNGEAGKLLACEKAAETLQGFVVSVSSAQENNFWTPRSTGRSSSTTRGKRSSGRLAAAKSTGEDPSATPKTVSKKGRKKRVSFGGVMDNNGKTPMLKSAKKPTPTPSNATSSNHGTKARPVLIAIIGLMQKLATTKALDRANLRGSTVKTLRCCLQKLPTLEQAMMLRFLFQLTRSKVSVHRLTGTELLGQLLTENWLWDNHADQPISTPESQPHSQVPATPPSNTRPDSPASSKSVDAEDTTTPFLNQSQDIPTSLFAALIGRLHDRAPAVRTRAAASISDLLRRISGAARLEDSGHFHSLIELRRALGSRAYVLTATLRRRAIGDDKATVRRVAIEALQELMLLGTYDDVCPVAIREEEVLVLGQLCNDNSLLTRKAAAQALTSLLERSIALSDIGDSDSIDLAARTWTESVLPMTLDAESGCVLKAIELVHEVVITPIVLDEDSEAFDERTAWRILKLVGESSMSGSTNKNLTAALKASLSKLTSTDSVYKDITRTLLKRICAVAVRTIDAPEVKLFHAEMEAERSGVWCLFDALVDQTTKLSLLYQTLKKLRMDLDFLGTSWEKMLSLLETPDLSKASSDLLRACMKSCLKLLSKMTCCVQIDISHQCAANLHSMLEKFVLPPDLIGSAVAALAATSIVCSGEEASVDQVRRDCEERLTSLYKTCEETISKYAKQILDGEHSPSEIEEEATVRAIFMVGEVAIVGFMPDENETNKSGKGKDSSNASEADPLKGLHIPPSKELCDKVMTFLPGRILGSDRTPERARAHAFTCIGKVCMRSGQEQLAGQVVKIFAREIKENFNDGGRSHGSPSVQSNALLVLGDLCCRYTNLVDRYLPAMACCLQSGLDADNSIIVTAKDDKAAIVRKNAILLLSSLLLQDYIKFRGLLFFRFLVASSDNDETVAQIGESILVGPLLAKNPKLFFNNFVESLFVLNRCVHPIYLSAKSAGDGGGGIAVDFEGINLTGPAGRAKRFRMYELMLSKFSDEEKIGVTARLAKEILGGAATSCSGALYKVCTNPMTKSDVDWAADRDYLSAFNVLSDTFAILSSPMLRVGKGATKLDDDDQDIIEDPNLPNPNRRVAVAKGKLLSKISRKHLIEIVFPILCNLKGVLQASCSPLLRDLMALMVHIYKSYKIESKEFLQTSDPNLLQEIEFDAKGGPKTPGVSGRKKKAAGPTSPEDADEDE